MTSHEQELRDKMTNAERTVSAPIQQAVVDVMVGGLKWRRAAIKNDVTESGIWRCVRRLGLKSTHLDTA